MQRLSSEQSFYRKFTKRFGEPPRIYADNSYDAAFLIYKAFKESKALGISLKDALRQIRHRGVNTDYVFSPVTSLARGSSTLVCMQQLPGGEIGAEYTRRQ